MYQLAGIGLFGTVAALAGSHYLAFRAGRRQRSATLAECTSDPSGSPAMPVMPTVPVLVVDNTDSANAALKLLDTDFATVPAYIATLRHQIDGVKADTEQGIALVISEVDAINGQAREQIGRMHASLDGSEALARSNDRPREIIGSLQTTLDERTDQIRTNFDSLSELAREFQTLRPTIESISTIADKAYFLSINAAVEAARAGPAGSAFALVAGEVRSLSTLTAAASREIGAGIATFTRRMQDELDRARPQVEGSGFELDRLILELGEVQNNLAKAGEELATMIQSMDGSHQQMVERLSSILGHVQFQDVVRQRLEQVDEAIGEFGDHVHSSVISARSDGVIVMPSLEDRLRAQQSRYVMQSQRQVFASVSGSQIVEDEAPRIELF